MNKPSNTISSNFQNHVEEIYSKNNLSFEEKKDIAKSLISFVDYATNFNWVLNKSMQMNFHDHVSKQEPRCSETKKAIKSYMNSQGMQVEISQILDYDDLFGLDVCFLEIKKV